MNSKLKNKLKNKLNEIIRIAGITLGSFISAIAINELLVPHHLLSGGVGGVALIIQYLSNYPAGALILIMNIPIFLVGIKETDKDFIVHSLLGMVMLSIFLIVLKDVYILRYIRVDDIMLSSVFGGVLSGLGGGIVFRNRGSLGGADIIAVVVKKKISANIGTVLLLINVIIIIIGSFLFGIKLAMFTLISMYITSNILDRVQEGFDRKKAVFIISEKEDEVAQAILNNLNRGVTFLYGEGAYTKDNKRIIYCIVTTKQLAKLKHIVHTVDTNAFLTISEASEVLGKGFKTTGI